MRLFSLLCFTTYFWATPPAWAVEKYESHKLSILTSIFRVDAPVAGETDYRVLSTVDGRIYKVAPSNQPALKILSVATSTHSNVELLLVPGNNEFIDSVEVISASRADAFALMNWEKDRVQDIQREARNLEHRLDGEDYRPSVLDDEAEASALFGSVYPYDHGYDVSDHCYDRAHYWVRTLFLQSGIKSMKVFLFFTPKYQRDHKYKWWFHVAPFVYVGDSREEFVLDPTYENDAVTIEQWPLHFARHASGCYDGKNINDYYSKGEKEDCVLIRTSMYHYSTSDLTKVPSVTSWRCADLRRVMSGIPAPHKRTWADVKGFLPGECQ